MKHIFVMLNLLQHPSKSKTIAAQTRRDGSRNKFGMTTVLGVAA